MKFQIFTEQIQTDYRIYVDMDGVLVDFVKGFEDRFGEDPETLENRIGKKAFDDNYLKKVDVNFWAQLKWLKGGKILWNYIRRYNPIILSMPFNDTFNKSILGKRQWIKRELGIYDEPVLRPSSFTKDSKIIISREKQNYIYGDPQKNILIDDRIKNITKWRAKGGIGILYRNVNQVINELDKILKNENYNNR